MGGESITALAKDLPEETIQAAKALGRSRDWTATAQEYLTRLYERSIPFLNKVNLDQN